MTRSPFFVTQKHADLGKLEHTGAAACAAPWREPGPEALDLGVRPANHGQAASGHNGDAAKSAATAGLAKDTFRARAPRHAGFGQGGAAIVQEKVFWARSLKNEFRDIG
ncbi:MAG: hypothetical protein KJN93_07820 [Alphaproteobacteria bacterium]|nr:hypothetical protein [Alphaproteobacteria bacterium]